MKPQVQRAGTQVTSSGSRVGMTIKAHLHSRAGEPIVKLSDCTASWTTLAETGTLQHSCKAKAANETIVERV